MSDRTESEIRADVDLAFAERESVGARGHARKRLAADVGPLLDRAQRAEAEIQRLRGDDLDRAHGVEHMRIGRSNLEDLRNLLSYPDAASLTEWEVVEIGGDELRRALADFARAEAERDQALVDLAHLREERERIRAALTGDERSSMQVACALMILNGEADEPSTPEPPTCSCPHTDPRAWSNGNCAVHAGRAPEPPTKPEATKPEWTSDLRSKPTVDGLYGYIQGSRAPSRTQQRDQQPTTEGTTT